MPKAHRIIPPLTAKDISRFWSKVDRGHPLLCWEWMGYCKGQRHGRFTVRQVPGGLSAHRVSWVIANGPIPAGMCVCHRCDNPPCCNPAHLFLAPQNENLKDMTRKGRRRGPALSGEKNASAKVTEAQVREIRRRYACGGILQRELAAEYGVSRVQVTHIVRRRNWKDV